MFATQKENALKWCYQHFLLSNEDFDNFLDWLYRDEEANE